MHLRVLQAYASALALLMATMTAAPSMSQNAAGPLTQQRADQLHQLLAPDADAPWRTIPWQTSVIDAQRIALERGKPIFIWAMDGHPLGCV